MPRTWFSVSLLPALLPAPLPALPECHHWQPQKVWRQTGDAAELLPANDDVAAAALPADREGTVLDAPPLADALCHDPVLRHLKLVALPSDDSLLPRCGATLLLVLPGA
jgi:hypothetical protein